MYETHMTVVGTLITAVGRRRLLDGTSVANFRVASNERRYDRQNETWTDGDTLYVSVSCWRQLAENVHGAFVVGDPIIVRGRLRTRNYEDKEGARKSVTELEAYAVGPDLARATAKVMRMRRDGSVPGTSTGEAADSSQETTVDDPWTAVVARSSGEPADEAQEFHPRAVEAAVGA